MNEETTTKNTNKFVTLHHANVQSNLIFRQIPYWSSKRIGNLQASQKQISPTTK